MTELILCPERVDFCISRGDTVPWTFTLKDAAGLPINITGYSFLLTVDPDEDPTSAANNLFQLVGTIVGDPLDGVVQFSLSTLQADQVPGVYWWDLQVTDSAGKIRTAAKGQFEFKQDVTK